jgi:hypothetical protein
MQYMLLIHSNEATDPKPGTPEMEAHMHAYFAFTEKAQAAGKMVAGDALLPVATATTVRVRDGETHTTDGPFAETKEQLGGYYILECEDLDEAIRYAAEIPSATMGSIEVRPVMKFD